MSEATHAPSATHEHSVARDSARAGKTGGGLHLASAPAFAFAGLLTAQSILALQRVAGNRAVSRLLDRQGRVPPAARALVPVQRDSQPVSIKGVTLNHSQITVPAESGLSLKAAFTPKNATGVKFKVEKDTVDPTAVSIDASGAITVNSGQAGGDIKVSAESSDGAAAWAGLRIIEKPVSLKSTSASDASKEGTYGGAFRHTFAGPGTSAAGLKGARINEKFDSLTADTPFGSFTLKANPAGSAGWGLDLSGTMNGDDNVTMGKSAIKAGDLIASASNPTPKKSLPQSFTMKQHMRAQSLPSGKWDDTAFADIDHVRGVEDRKGVIKVVVKAGKGEVALDYEGPPAYRNAKASPAKVAASSPAPKAEKGKPAPEWKRNEVTVTAEVIPAGGKLVYSIVEAGAARLGCEIDSSSGVVKIGAKAGTITVRASDGKGAHYDEVKIEITSPPTPPAAKKTESEGAGEAEELLATPPAGEEP